MKNQKPNVKEPTKTLSIAEQEALIKEEIQKVIKLAKEKTSITIEEINEMLPPEIIAVGVLDQFMHALEANSVVIKDPIDPNKSDEDGDTFLADADKEEDEADEDEKAEESYSL